MVINLGIAFGAGLYEARVVVPRWADLPPKDWPNTGLLFWVYVTTVPLTLLAFANLMLDKSVRRNWWLDAVFILLMERLTTFSYFIPTMINLRLRICPTQRPAQSYRNGFFSITGDIFILGGVVDGAQSIVVTVNH
jgi:hypothetical protein